MKRVVLITVILVVGSFLGVERWLIGGRALAAGAPIHRGATVTEGDQYPLHSEQFNQFIADSYEEPSAQQVGDFYKWLGDAYASSPVKIPTAKEASSLEEALAARGSELTALNDPEQRAQAEIETGAATHRMIKKIIPRFSLDRGFEFCNIVKCGERQCFLQSVLITGLLQSMKINAGVVMVYRNPKGQESNNGHAVTLVRLANGKEILVDASEPEPFPRHEGLFVRSSEYRYVEPAYTPSDPPVILSYKSAGSGQPVETAQVEPMDVHFIRSQFDYYRGERATGGIVSAKPTPEGLDESARYLRASIESCPRNPLAVYTLGRVYVKQGKTAEARTEFATAVRLYTAAGWCPQSARDFLARAGGG